MMHSEHIVKLNNMFVHLISRFTSETTGKTLMSFGTGVSHQHLSDDEFNLGIYAQL